MLLLPINPSIWTPRSGPYVPHPHLRHPPSNPRSHQLTFALTLTLTLSFTLSFHTIAHGARVSRFDMLALTDFQQASHRLQRTPSRQLLINDSHPGDHFGAALTSLGDIDNDAASEFAVTSLHPLTRQVTVNIIRITQKSHAQLLSTQPLFTSSRRLYLTALSLIGHTLYQYRRQTAFAIGVPMHPPSGAVFVSLINQDARPNSPLAQLPSPPLPSHARFGASLAYVGDLDADGHNDLIIGAPGDSAMFAAFLDDRSRLKSYTRIPTGHSKRDTFAISMTSIGDINDDGRMELLVASAKHIYLVFLSTEATIARKVQLELPVIATRSLSRASALSFVGLDGSDNVIFAIGNRHDNDGGAEKGAIWVASIDVNGTVLRCVKFSETQGNLDGKLERGDHFGASLATALDVNKDGSAELLVGVPRPSSTLSHFMKSGRTQRDRPGALWIIDVPGSRSVRITNLKEVGPMFGCVFTQSSCTCSFRQRQRTTCLAMARTTAAGPFCRERYCTNSFECGKLASHPHIFRSLAVLIASSLLLEG